MIVPQIVGAGVGQPPGLTPAGATDRISAAVLMLCAKLQAGREIFDAAAEMAPAFTPMLSAEELHIIIPQAKACLAARTPPPGGFTFKLLTPGEEPAAPVIPTQGPPTPDPVLEQLTNLICAARADGQTDDAIRANLTASGNKTLAITLAFLQAAARCPPAGVAPVPLPTAPNIPTTPTIPSASPTSSRTKKIAIGVGVGLAGLTLLYLLLR